MLLDGHTLEFYKWDSDVNELLENVRRSINKCVCVLGMHRQRGVQGPGLTAGACSCLRGWKVQVQARDTKHLGVMLQRIALWCMSQDGGGLVGGREGALPGGDGGQLQVQRHHPALHHGDCVSNS